MSFCRMAIQRMSAAYSNKSLTFPVEHVRHLLALDTNEMAGGLCRHYGMTVDGEKIQFLKSSWNNEDSVSNFLAHLTLDQNL